MPDNSSSNKTIAKNSIFLSLRMVIVLLISLYTTRVILQILGVVDYGVYNVVCGFVAMFGFLNTSMSNGIQRFFNYEYGKNGEEGANSVYCTSIYIQALLAIIVVVIVEAFGLWYLHNKMVIPEDRMNAAEWVFQLAIFAFVINIMLAPFAAAVTAHEKFDFYAVVSVADALLKLGIVFLIQLVPADKLIVYGFFSTAVALFNFSIYFIYCKKKFTEIHFKREFDRNLFKDMLGFSGWNLFGSFSNVMEVQGINLVMNFFFGPVVNAARGVANQINSGVQSFVSNITVPVRPQVTQSYAKGDIQRTIGLTYGVSKMSCAIVLLLAIPASIEIDYILKLWLGDSIPDHTSTFTMLILLTSVISNLNAPISNVVHATGVMRDYQLFASLTRLCSIPLAYFLIKIYKIPELGLIAVFVMSTITHMVCLIIARKLVKFSIHEYLRVVVYPTMFILVVVVALVYPLHYFMQEGWLRLILVCILSFVLTGLSFFYIAFNKSERQLALQLIRPIVNMFKRIK